MIGGFDTVFDGPSGPEALDYVLRLLRIAWPACVFVPDDEPNPKPYAELAFHDRSEVLVYRDIAACTAWDLLGYDESLKGTMFYLLCGPSSLTIVTETEPTAGVVHILDQITSDLLWFRIPAYLAAA